MTPEDVALYKADPDYAATLGIVLRCERCSEPIKWVMGWWDGGPARHVVCPKDLQRETDG